MDADEKIKISVRNLDFFYARGHQALFGNSIDIPANRITAVIGPSGCGKSTHLRVYNRIFELYRGQRAGGEGSDLASHPHETSGCLGDSPDDVREIHPKGEILAHRARQSEQRLAVDALGDDIGADDIGEKSLP